MKKTSELWETPTDGNCRIFQLENGAVGLASSHVQQGDRIFNCPELGDLYLVFRGWDEAQHDAPNFILIGRAMQLEDWGSLPRIYEGAGKSLPVHLRNFDVNCHMLTLSQLLPRGLIGTSM